MGQISLLRPRRSLLSPHGPRGPGSRDRSIDSTTHRPTHWELWAWAEGPATRHSTATDQLCDRSQVRHLSETPSLICRMGVIPRLLSRVLNMTTWAEQPRWHLARCESPGCRLQLRATRNSAMAPQASGTPFQRDPSPNKGIRKDPCLASMPLTVRRMCVPTLFIKAPRPCQTGCSPRNPEANSGPVLEPRAGRAGPCEELGMDSLLESLGAQVFKIN